jgi:hypothetical protein
MLLALIFFSQARAASLPTGMSEDEIKDVLKTISISAIHRGWTAHSQPYEGRLGMNLGLESTFVPSRNMDRAGNRNGTLPPVVPVPRLWAGFQYSSDLYLSASFAPGQIFDGVMAAGGGLQWTFQRDKSREFALSLAFNYSYIDLFNDVSGNHMTLLFGAAKDLLVWQPYFLGGIAIANGTTGSSIPDTGVARGPHTVLCPQLSVGARVDLLAKLSIQLDVIGTRASAAVLLEKDF